MKYLVLAGNEQIFRRWCIQKGINPREARRIISPSDLNGRLGPDIQVIFTCHYAENQEFSEINAILMSYRILPLYESCCDREVG